MPLRSLSEEALVRGAWAECDTDKNGTIDANELAAIAAKFGHALTVAECSDVISRYSDDKVMTFPQFQSWWQSDNISDKLKQGLQKHVAEDAELRFLRREVKELHKILERVPDLTRNYYAEEAVAAMQQTTLFSQVPESVLKKVAQKMTRQQFDQGTFITRQDQVVVDAMIVAQGSVTRWAEVDGRKQIVNTFCPNSIGTLHLYSREYKHEGAYPAKSRFNAHCDTDVVVYVITRHDLDALMRTEPDLSIAMVESLTRYIKGQQPTFSTPMFEQRAHKTTFTATTMAATIESFYRSGMNALINQKIMGGQRGALFPHMHIQIPTRVVYINGIKQVRAHLDKIDTSRFGDLAGIARMGIAFAPGVIMCPMSSVLEATNAGKLNPEPILRRASRGFVPRLGREVVFGVGLNQLADFVGERAESMFSNKAIARNLGSMTAGLIAGYLSHIPHVLSTKKLNEPHKSYAELWKEVWSLSVQRTPNSLEESQRHRLAKLYAVACPVGCVRRSFQIAGTFIIINGVTYAARNKDWY